MEVLVFGGTVEGRMLVEWLEERGTCDVVACVTTDYGASLLEPSPRVTVLRGPLSASEKHQLVAAHRFCCIVDATHPYATHISESVRQLGAESGIDVVRIVREEVEGGAWTSVSCAKEAARLLAQSEGNVLLTTGSKDLPTYVSAFAGQEERLYVRILPVLEALAQARELGVPTSHVIAMQGPFSTELNVALLRQFDICHLVTKQSGPTGGFCEKVEAAQICGTQVIVIERPYEEGVLLGEAQRLLEERYGL